MSAIKRGIVGFGMSSALLVGGAAAIHEWESQWSEIHERAACAQEANIGNVACEGIVLQPDQSNENKAGETLPYSVVGTIALVIGGLGAVGSIGETLGWGGLEVELTD